MVGFFFAFKTPHGLDMSGPSLLSRVLSGRSQSAAHRAAEQPLLGWAVMLHWGNLLPMA